LKKLGRNRSAETPSFNGLRRGIAGFGRKILGIVAALDLMLREDSVYGIPVGEVSSIL
jgi:hypothetical protein